MWCGSPLLHKVSLRKHEATQRALCTFVKQLHFDRRESEVVWGSVTNKKATEWESNES